MAATEPAPEGWKVDPTGGFIKLPPPAPEPEPIPYGWKEDPDGTGLIRIPDDELPPLPRKGYWCTITGLTKNTDMNGMVVEVKKPEVDPDGFGMCTLPLCQSTPVAQLTPLSWCCAVEVLHGQDAYQIYPKNLTPLAGSEKVMDVHKQ